jgi:hypothetical protein
MLFAVRTADLLHLRTRKKIRPAELLLADCHESHKVALAIRCLKTQRFLYRFREQTYPRSARGTLGKGNLERGRRLAGLIGPHSDNLILRHGLLCTSRQTAKRLRSEVHLPSTCGGTKPIEVDRACDILQPRTGSKQRRQYAERCGICPDRYCALQPQMLL